MSGQEWQNELVRLAGSVQLVAGIGHEVESIVIRRRRRRRTLVVSAAASGVAAVLVTTTLLPGTPATRTEQAPEVTAMPATRPMACAESGYGDPPAPENLAEQEQIIDAALGFEDPRFDVIRADPGALGVVALVEGDVEAARTALTGVAIVATRLPDVGLTDDEQLIVAAQSRLQPTVQRLLRKYGARDGFFQMGYWNELPGVVLSFKAPIPADVAAEAGIDDRGVQVVVMPTRFAQDELTAAGRRLHDAKGLQVDVSSTSACNDGSGLSVGVREFPDDVDALRGQLAVIAGVPIGPIEVSNIVGF